MTTDLEVALTGCFEEVTATDNELVNIQLLLLLENEREVGKEA